MSQLFYFGIPLTPGPRPCDGEKYRLGDMTFVLIKHQEWKKWQPITNLLTFCKGSQVVSWKSVTVTVNVIHFFYERALPIENIICNDGDRMFTNNIPWKHWLVTPGDWNERKEGKRGESQKVVCPNGPSGSSSWCKSSSVHVTATQYGQLMPEALNRPSTWSSWSCLQQPC